MYVRNGTWWGWGGYIELIQRSVQLRHYIVQMQSGQETTKHHLSTTVTDISCSVAFPFCVGLLAEKFVLLALAKLNSLKLVISVGFSVY